MIEASSAEGALRRLERIHRPVLLISDINLGEGMTGLELAAEVRQLWPAISILLISSGNEALLAANPVGSWSPVPAKARQIAWKAA